MQRVATGCVAAALGLRLGAGFLEDAAWVGYLKAFSEASVVGGLADWFAVTALFRHPLGLKIPHTRILPKSKDRLGASLADFVTGNFLNRESVDRELARIDVAGHIGSFLAEHTESLSERAAEFVPRLFDALDDDGISRFLSGKIGGKLRETDFSPLAGRALETLTSGGKGSRVAGDLLRAAAAALQENQDVIVKFVRQKLPLPDHVEVLGISLPLPLEGVKGKLAQKIGEEIVKHLLRWVVEVEQDENHEIRLRIGGRLERVVRDLKSDPEMKVRVAHWRDELLANENVSDYVSDVWREAKAALLEDLADPQGGVRRQMEHALRGFGVRLRGDDPLRSQLNARLRPFLADAVCASASTCGRVMRETVHLWDAGEMADKLELEVGRDLQFVRLNGTLVGGLLGLLLHAMMSFF